MSSGGNHSHRKGWVTSNLTAIEISIILISTLLEWKGNWFPGPPENFTASTSTTPSGAEPTTDEHGRVQMGVENPDCDDAQRNLAIDFDPNDIRYATVSMCLDNRHEYRGDYNMEPLITLSNVPDAYVALHRCMDQPIEYEERIPTL